MRRSAGARGRQESQRERATSPAASDRKRGTARTNPRRRKRHAERTPGDNEGRARRREARRRRGEATPAAARPDKGAGARLGAHATTHGQDAEAGAKFTPKRHRKGVNRSQVHPQTAQLRGELGAPQDGKAERRPHQPPAQQQRPERSRGRVAAGDVVAAGWPLAHMRKYIRERNTRRR